MCMIQYFKKLEYNINKKNIILYNIDYRTLKFIADIYNLNKICCLFLLYIYYIVLFKNYIKLLILDISLLI